MRVLLCLALTLAAPAAARDLPVPPGKGWQHADTGLVLTATLDGLPRTKLVDSTTVEADVVAEFADPGHTLVATVYLFHPGLDDVAVWFDRSQTELEARDIYGGATPASAAPVAFVPPRGAVATALRQVYVPRKRPYRSTALAMMPLGGWLVAVRMSATDLDSAGLDARLGRIIAAIRWPATPAAAGALPVHPVEPCPAPLGYAKAKPIKPNGSELVMNAFAGTLADHAKAAPQPAGVATWCRDPASTRDYGVYHGSSSLPSSYALAINDAGRAVFVQPSLSMQIGEGTSYSVTLDDVDGSTVSFPSFDGLPEPSQVAELVFKGQSIARSTTANGRTDIQLTPGALQ